MLKYSMVVIAKEIIHYCRIALFNRQRRYKRKKNKCTRFYTHGVKKKVSLGRNLIQEN